MATRSILESATPAAPATPIPPKIRCRTVFTDRAPAIYIFTAPIPARLRPATMCFSRYGHPTITADSVQKDFAKFFTDCENKLKNPLEQWPKLWGDLPGDYTTEQENLLKNS